MIGSEPARSALVRALTNVSYRYLELLAELGLNEACERQPALLGGINVMNGKLTCKAVADADGVATGETALTRRL